jgi:hypothetical protein
MELEELETQMEDLKKAMEDEYEKNKESTLYLELYETFREAEERYEAAKKESEEFWDAFNHRRKMCIYCGGFEFGEGACPSRRAGATGHCPSRP